MSRQSYRYIVKRENLSDDELLSLGMSKEAVSEYSPREFRSYECTDCIFPNGDIYPLEPGDLELDSAVAL